MRTVEIRPLLNYRRVIGVTCSRRSANQLWARSSLLFSAGSIAGTFANVTGLQSCFGCPRGRFSVKPLAGLIGASESAWSLLYPPCSAGSLQMSATATCAVASYIYVALAVALTIVLLLLCGFEMATGNCTQCAPGSWAEEKQPICKLCNGTHALSVCPSHLINS